MFKKYSDLQNKLPVAIKINVVNVSYSLSYWLGFLWQVFIIYHLKKKKKNFSSIMPLFDW